jgi:pimeloyl-ACP methyl ester carboxylesterase
MPVALLDGWRVVYETRGEGSRTIAFVHGGASDRTVWQAQLEGLRADRRLVAMDLLGHGASDKPDVLYSMDLFARCVAAVLDQIGVERAVLVGHSNGVPVSRQFYRCYPERTDALVAVDGAFRQPIPQATVDWMLASLRRPDYEQFMQGLVEQMQIGQVPPADRERIVASMLATPRHVMTGSLEALLDPAVWTEDPIAVPLLVLLAGGQPQWGADYEAFVRRLAPRVEYHVWDDVSHFLMLERPTAFNDLLAGFLRRSDSEGAPATD